MATQNSCDYSPIQYNVLVGGANGTIDNVAPSSTTGYVLTSNGSSSNPTFQVATGGGIATLDGDTGSATGSTVTISAGNVSQTCGSSVLFTGSGSTLSLKVSDSINNTIIGSASGNATLTGHYNTSLGDECVQLLTSGQANVSVGQGSGISITSGSFNVLLGTSAGSGYTSSESSNICINSLGTVSESHALRIGRGTGTSAYELSTAYISGINGNTVSNQLLVTINSSTDQLGTTSAAGAGAITTITGNTGGAEVPSSGNFNILGTGSITVVGSTNTETVQLTGLTNHNVLIGAGTATITNVAPGSASTVLASNGASSDPSFQTITVGDATGITFFNGTNGTTLTGTTSGMIITASAKSSGNGAPVNITGGSTTDLVGGNINLTAGSPGDTSAGGSVNINGANGGAVSGAGGSIILTSGDAGPVGNAGPINLTGGVGGSTSGNGSNINITAGNSTTSGNGGNITLTAGSLAGGGSNGQILMTNGVVGVSVANQTILTINSSTGQIGNTSIVPVANGGTGDGSFTAYSVICGGTTSTGALQNVSGVGSSGQVLTSNGASNLPTWQAATGGGLAWSNKATDFNAAASNGYFVTATSIATLPASPSNGDTIILVNAGAGASGIVVQANTGQTISVGGTSSTSAGTATSNASGDAITLVYNSTHTNWYGYGVQGTFTLA